MLSSLKKMRGDKKGWYKVSDLRPGVEIAVPDDRPQAQPQHLHWDEIVSITPVGREQVYDIEVEGTHNFVGNGIFAHNTYALRVNTMLAVEGRVNAGSFVAPAPVASSTLMAEIPSAVLTADGLGVDLYKLATHNLAATMVLAARMDAEEVRVTSLESRVEKLESGAVSSSGSPISLLTTSLASALESLGAYISNGFAQFGSLVADRFVAAADSAGTSSAGTVSILIGNTVAQVTNAYVKASTKVFITFNAPVTGSWYVADKQEGSFRVVLSTAQTTDVSFDYFLVQTEGQVATSTSEVISNSQFPISNQFSSTNETTNSPASSTSETAPAPESATSTPASGDTVAPVVTLTGEAAMEVMVGDTFTDPGATAVDDTDGDLTTHIIVSGAVDTAPAGLYELTYSATDAAGNTGSVSRVATVIATVDTSTMIGTDATAATP